VLLTSWFFSYYFDSQLLRTSIMLQLISTPHFHLKSSINTSSSDFRRTYAEIDRRTKSISYHPTGSGYCEQIYGRG
jgi:hypothetical protein